MRVAFANLGAEEDAAPPVDREAPAARLAALFERVVEAPPWPALAAAEGLVPWLSTAAAAQEAARRGLPLWAAAAHVVRAVHDKAFALSCAVEHSLGVDDVLTQLARAFDADALGDDGASAIEAHMARWPAWARARATLKPRIGTSGRGRVAVTDGRLDERARAALPRLAARGGCVLEPFVARTLDVSALFFVPPVGAPVFLGSTAQRLSVAGVYAGCEAQPCADGLWRAGSAIDDGVERDARVVVGAAQRVGFWGFCGVDAFSYDGGARVRTAVELNARFTAGHVALALFLAQSAAQPLAQPLAQLSAQPSAQPSARSSAPLPPLHGRLSFAVSREPAVAAVGA